MFPFLLSSVEGWLCGGCGFSRGAVLAVLPGWCASDREWEDSRRSGCCLPAPYASHFTASQRTQSSWYLVSSSDGRSRSRRAGFLASAVDQWRASGPSLRQAPTKAEDGGAAQLLSGDAVQRQRSPSYVARSGGGRVTGAFFKMSSSTGSPCHFPAARREVPRRRTMSAGWDGSRQPP